MTDLDVLREVVLPKLEGVRKTGSGWSARCPAHDDHRPSLSLGYGTEQPVVFHCQAGCSQESVRAALGYDSWEAMCRPREAATVRGEWTPHGEAVAVYDYVDEQGELLYQVLRTADKQFPVRVPDQSRKSGWRWTLGDTRRVLYRLPKVMEAVAAGEAVYICEGEKDVQALERAGVTATCSPAGAGKWRPEYAGFFREAYVRVVADADKPGRAHARQVAATLQDVAASVEVVEAAVGKDAADHLAAGKTLTDFLVTSPAGAPDVELAQDLYVFLAEKDPDESWVIPGLLERGDRLIWTGREGLGKTMMTRQIAVCAAAGLHPFYCDPATRVPFTYDPKGFPCEPRKVLFIDLENPPRKSRRKFRYLADLVAKFGQRVPEGNLRLIHRPAGVDLTREDEAAWLLERVRAHQPDMLVIGPLYKLHAVDANEETAARVITQVLDNARGQGDFALFMEAHAPHGSSYTTGPLRPVGSSLFMRWPEFGYGIRATADAAGRTQRRFVELDAWRGPREERNWPLQLRWGQPEFELPWVEVPQGH